MPKGDGNRWEPTKEHLKQIETMAGYGLGNRQIAGVLGIHRTTLERHANNEESLVHAAIEKGKGIAASQVTKTLYEMITKDRNVAATIFFCKTRLGWSETPEEREDKNSYKPPVTLARSA